VPSTFLWWLTGEQSGRVADWQCLDENWQGRVKLGQMKGKMEKKIRA